MDLGRNLQAFFFLEVVRCEELPRPGFGCHWEMWGYGCWSGLGLSLAARDVSVRSNVEICVDPMPIRTNRELLPQQRPAK